MTEGLGWICARTVSSGRVCRQWAVDSSTQRAAFLARLPPHLEATTPPTPPEVLYGDALLARQTTVEAMWSEENRTHAAGVGDVTAAAGMGDVILSLAHG